MASRGVLFLLVAASAACKKTPPPAADAAPNVPVVVATARDLPPPEFGDPVNPDARAQLPISEDPQENVLIPTGQQVGAPSAAPTAPPPDPFEAAIASVRASAVGCFVGQPKGEYSGTISVVVTPAGNVSRVEATSSTDDPVIGKCLERAATRNYPTTTDGRKLSIEVRVAG